MSTYNTKIERINVTWYLVKIRRIVNITIYYIPVDIGLH